MTEFNGDIEPSGVYNNRILTASEKLKLVYRTGQNKSAEVYPDPLIWQGLDPSNDKYQEQPE